MLLSASPTLSHGKEGVEGFTGRRAPGLLETFRCTMNQRRLDPKSLSHLSAAVCSRDHAAAPLE
eukprot:2739280-Pleurochrysis_carterae.AAC.1